MRLALLSDVHSNLQALEAVLADIEALDPDGVAFLGDCVGYNANPRQCLHRLVDTCDRFLVGNHEEAVLDGGEEWFSETARVGVRHSRRELDDEDLDVLRTWERQTNWSSVHLVHGSPRAPTTEYVFPETHVEVLEEITNDPSVGESLVVAMGHTHVPFTRRVGELLVVNVGSVGQPRDGDPRAAWCLVDTDEVKAQVHRVDYDIEAAARAIRDAGLPDRSAERLFEGH